MPETFEEMLTSTGATFADGGTRVLDFGDSAAEYGAARGAAGLYPALARGVIEVGGKDRATWLHNLTTNAIKTLQPGEGNYTFACSVKGRILLDFNVLVLADAIWLDIDRRLVQKALAHFERYHIAEDVRLTDRCDEFVRIAMLGPGASQIADAIGAAHAGSMASLGSSVATLAGRSRLLVRHDSAGVIGLELYIESADAATCWKRLLEIGRPVGLRPIGDVAVEALRIEAGMPASLQDINEDVLPAETQQIERAVSYVKGCYLGQEVVERMRSHGALARRLVGLRIEGTIVPEVPTPLQVEGAEVGRLTSASRSPASGQVIGLGYVKSAHAAPGTRVSLEHRGGAATAQVARFPLGGNEPV